MRLVFLVGMVTWHINQCATEIAAPMISTMENAKKISNPPDVSSSTKPIKRSPEELHEYYRIYCLSRREKFFSQKFFKAMVEHSVLGDIIFAPFPVSFGLWMLAEGARGNTYEQLRSVLVHEEDDVLEDRRYEDFFAAERNILRHVPYIMYSQVFYREDLSIDPNYEHAINTKFQSVIRTFEKCHPPRASYTMNKWTNFGTHNHEREIFTADGDDIKQEATLNLVTWFGFKGRWSKSFDESKTKTSIFNLDNITNRSLEIMTIEGLYRYGEIPEIHARYIAIPYKASVNTSAAMIIVLPNEIGGLHMVESNFEKIDAYKIMYETKYRNVRLRLPKVNVSSTYNLNEPLRNMGLTEMFTDKANFTAIDETVPMKFGTIKHKVSMQINEYGTWPVGHDEITVMSDDEMPKAENEELVTFDINHPFIVIIRTSGHTNINLITGRYTGF